MYRKPDFGQEYRISPPKFFRQTRTNLAYLAKRPPLAIENMAHERSKKRWFVSPQNKFSTRRRFQNSFKIEQVEGSSGLVPAFRLALSRDNKRKVQRLFLSPRTKHSPNLEKSNASCPSIEIAFRSSNQPRKQRRSQNHLVHGQRISQGQDLRLWLQQILKRAFVHKGQASRLEKSQSNQALPQLH